MKQTERQTDRHWWREGGGVRGEKWADRQWGHGRDRVGRETGMCDVWGGGGGDREGNEMERETGRGRGGEKGKGGGRQMIKTQKTQIVGYFWLVCVW